MKIITSSKDLTKKTFKGCTIPTIGMGTFEMTGMECRTAVRDALEMGYRHIDTAQAYDNEGEVGTAIKEAGIDRSEIFLTDKIHFGNLRPEDLKESFRNSLVKLQTDYIDLLLIHWPSPNNVPLKETIDAMYQIKLSGGIRHVGVSNFTPELLKEALTYENIVANQVEYHPYLAQTELLEMCSNFDTFLIAYSPLARGEMPENELIAKIGKKYGKAPAQVVLRWLIEQHCVVAIPKASSKEHRKDNLNVFDFELTEDEMLQISNLEKGMRTIDPDYAPNWN